MIKGIDGHGYYDRLVVPIIENTARECDLADRMAARDRSLSKSHAVLVRRHGVYIWGRDWVHAKTQAECYHYLFEAAVRMAQLGVDASAAGVRAKRRSAARVRVGGVSNESALARRRGAIGDTDELGARTACTTRSSAPTTRATQAAARCAQGRSAATSSKTSSSSSPSTPNLDAICAKFVDEHFHDDDEVRFVLEGEGIFDIRSRDDRWMRVVGRAGDLIVVPKDRHHRFMLTEQKTDPLRAPVPGQERLGAALSRGVARGRPAFNRPAPAQRNAEQLEVALSDLVEADGSPWPAMWVNCSAPLRRAPRTQPARSGEVAHDHVGQVAASRSSPWPGRVGLDRRADHARHGVDQQEHRAIDVGRRMRSCDREQMPAANLGQVLLEAVHFVSSPTFGTSWQSTWCSCGSTGRRSIIPRTSSRARRRGWAAVAATARVERLAHPVEVALDERGDQRLLAGEVLVERADAHAGGVARCGWCWRGRSPPRPGRGRSP